MTEAEGPWSLGEGQAKVMPWIGEGGIFLEGEAPRPTTVTPHQLSPGQATLTSGLRYTHCTQTYLPASTFTPRVSPPHNSQLVFAKYVRSHHSLPQNLPMASHKMQNKAEIPHPGHAAK